MTTFVMEETIAGSPDEIWAYAADIRRHPEWMGVTDARVVRGDVSLDLEPVAGHGAKATYASDLRLRGLWRLLAPIAAIEAKAGPERELQRLKARFDGRTSGERP